MHACVGQKYVLNGVLKITLIDTIALKKVTKHFI